MKVKVKIEKKSLQEKKNFGKVAIMLDKLDEAKKQTVKATQQLKKL